MRIFIIWSIFLLASINSTFAVIKTPLEIAGHSTKFNHGPYLQELTESGVTIVFTTDTKSFSWIEVRKTDDNKNNASKFFYGIDNGLRVANNTFNTIRINGLQQNKKYSYRLVSLPITHFEPTKVIFADTIRTNWIDFKTPDPKADKLTFLVTNDIHSDTVKLDKLFNYAGLESAEMVFFVGDMVQRTNLTDHPLTSYVDFCVRRFASSRPFTLMRGNHEVASNYAREMSTLFPRRNGKFYGSYMAGGVMFVMLDSGDKNQDSASEYFGLYDFDKYRDEQITWLKELVETQEFKQARLRIVMSHIPPTPEFVMYTGGEIARLFIPILNKANIDLMLCGHTHSFAHIDPSAEMNFPLIISDNRSISRVEVSGNGFTLKMYNNDGVEKFSMQKPNK